MRINIDSKFFTDARIDLLAQMTQMTRLEIEGRILRLWLFCYNNLKSTLTRKDIKIQSLGIDADFLIECDLAVLTDGEVRIKGVDDRIEWLKKSQLGGKKSAANRLLKYGTASPKGSRRVHEGCFEKTQKITKAIEVHSHSHSLSLKEDISNLENLTDKKRYLKKYINRQVEQNPFDKSLAEKWLAYARQKVPELNPKIETWVEAIRKMREIDKIPAEKLEALLEFVKNDSFWSKVANSPAALRKVSENGNKKFENILLAMASKPKIREIRLLPDDDLAI